MSLHLSTYNQSLTRPQKVEGEAQGDESKLKVNSQDPAPLPLLIARPGLCPAFEQGPLGCFRGQGGAQRNRCQARREQFQSVMMSQRVKMSRSRGGSDGA